MNNRTDLIAHTAELYYEQGLSQSDISKMLNISRPTVSRFLEEARDLGIVEIIVHHPVHQNSALSAQLRQVFRLREAIVTAGVYSPELSRSLCVRRAASFLGSILENGSTLGITWGRTMEALCEEIKDRDYYNISIVQMAGCLGNGNPHYDGIELAQRYARKFNGTYTNIVAPVYVNDRIVYDHLVQTPQIRGALKKASEIDVAVTGIGSLSDPDSSLLKAGCYTIEDSRDAMDRGAVGHILARLYNKEGRELYFRNHFPIAAPLSSMKSADWSIGIEVSEKKASAVLGAVKGGWLNTLIVDEPLALELLRLEGVMPYRNTSDKSPIH